MRRSRGAEGQYWHEGGGEAHPSSTAVTRWTLAVSGTAAGRQVGRPAETAGPGTKVERDAQRDPVLARG